MPSAERAAEVARAREIPGAREPGGQRRPAEPEQGAWGDVLADAGAARAALVGRRNGQTGNLHHVEVVQQADPHDAENDVQPARQAQFVERRGRNGERQQQRKHETGRDGPANGVEWIHWYWIPGSVKIFFKDGDLERPPAEKRLKNRRRDPIIQCPARRAHEAA